VELLTIIVCLVDIGGIVDHHCLFIVSFKNNQILNDLMLLKEHKTNN
jgi:hypothetical protein